MTAIVPFLWLAGVLQLLVASANFFAPRMLHFRDNLARLDPTVREIFVIRGQFLVLALIAFALLCFGFATELTGGSLLGRCLCGFLALFWGLRAIYQLVHYNAEIKRRYPVFNLLFLGTFVVLAGIFTVVAIR
jgi:hypothetical protein